MPMTERVVPWIASVRWEPNAPAAVLIVTDAGLAALALRPHPADTGHTCVVFAWSGTQEAVMGAPNDEARPGHQLHKRGLAELSWAGTVEHSERIARLEQANRIHRRHDAERFSRLHHYILPLKEDTVEVIAETVTVQRQPGPPLHAASLALRAT
jgi:hypothetical protein